MFFFGRSRYGMRLYNKLIIAFAVVTATPYVGFSQTDLRWSLQKDKISWQVKEGEKPHTDHIEMSGKNISAIITYGTKEKNELVVKKQLVFPMLRTLPNNTYGSFQTTLNDGFLQPLLVNDVAIKEFPSSFSLNGMLCIKSKTNSALTIERKIFPSTQKPALVEMVNLINTGISLLKSIFQIKILATHLK